MDGLTNRQMDGFEQSLAIYFRLWDNGELGVVIKRIGLMLYSEINLFCIADNAFTNVDLMTCMNLTDWEFSIANGDEKVMNYVDFNSIHVCTENQFIYNLQNLRMC